MDKKDFKSLKKLKVHPVVKRVWIFTFIIVLFVIGILFLPWQQTVKGVGEVIASNPTERNYYILAPISGFIKDFNIQEDQFVKKGTVLFTMVDLDKKYLDRLQKIKKNTEKQYKNTKKELEVLYGKLKNLEEGLKIGTDIYNKKINQIKDKIKSLELKKLSLEKNYDVVKSNYDRIKALYDEGIESKRKLEVAENKLIKAKTDLNKIEIDIKIQKQSFDIAKEEREKFVRETQTKIQNTEKEILTAKTKINSYKKEIQKIESQISKFKTSSVIAEKDGYVVRILKNDKNQFIKKGDKIVLFSPTVKKRAVLLKISNFDMPLIKKGLSVRLQFYGWPTLQISGWPVIKFGTFGGIIDKIDPVAHQKNVYYAYVIPDPDEPWPPPDTLKIGTQATGWVKLSIVPIWYEIWRRVNAFPPKMVNPYKEGEK